MRQFGPGWVLSRFCRKMANDRGILSLGYFLINFKIKNVYTI